ncbi:hypothetical protein [Shimia aestuarii]|uniref:hypothetical protein n=1 Tax=Shimia aestuarii TaxID=254406 RepID=UPI001FB2078E|nr:hypothetical protein [Shimia aestuarii]
MKRFLITCAALVSACGDNDPAVRVTAPPISADLLQPEPGWTGGAPRTERDFALAVAAERAGRIRANGKLETIGETLSSKPYKPR